MHDCPECQANCDCDGEDMHMDLLDPEDCIHDCEPDLIDDLLEDCESDAELP